MERTDIRYTDVFFSWTGNDREMKNTIVAYLRAHNISCTEADDDCVGDFRQWSYEAVSKSTVFLLLYTENAPHSQYIPKEIEALKELDDYANRCIPVVTKDLALFNQKHPDLANQESAIILNDSKLTEKHLEEILKKVQNLICNRMYAIYRQTTAPSYLRFVSLLRELRLTREFDHEKLYIDRTVTDKDGNAFSDAAAFCHAEDIIYLHGPAGSGKTCYIDQLRSAADDRTLVLALPCRNLTKAVSLFGAMYEEFCRYIGNREFYSEYRFRSLLPVKHLLLVLDGFDEIATKAEKDRVLELTRHYYLANAASTTLIVTCRNSDDADSWRMNGQSPKILQLNSLEEDQIRAFGTNLFLLFGDPEKSNDFYIGLQELESEIRTNPLLLSQLAIIYELEDRLPQTIVGIYDAICQITIDSERLRATAPAEFDPAIFRKLSDILKAFSAERYLLASQGKEKTAEQIFKKILRDQGYDPGDALYLIRFLHDRAIFVGNSEFYHKMLQEYFTAVYYFDRCFDDYGELEAEEMLAGLFIHYSEPYWSAVLQLFLVKADSCADATSTADLYRRLMGYGITDFTLLFDTCQKLLCHKEPAQKALLTDILSRSAENIYPPYGPLCWYVPEYELYPVLLSALEALQDQPCFTKALALCRDVCWIYGKYHTAQTLDSQIDGHALLAKADLSGIRKGLCELFYLGKTDCADGADVYPRCFNIAEVKNWMAEGQGIFGRMATPFEDELGLYTHEMLRPFGGEWVGIVATRYDIAHIEEALPSRSCKKLNALFLSPTENKQLEKLAINSNHIRVFYAPENIDTTQANCLSRLPLTQYLFISEKRLLYFFEELVIPDGITEIAENTFADYRALKIITIPVSVTAIGGSAFRGCSSLTTINILDGVNEIGEGAFSNCSSLTSIKFPDSLTKIGDRAFQGCKSLTSINIPYGVTKIRGGVFWDCSSLTSIKIPDSLTEIGDSAFQGCKSLSSINIPDGVTEIGMCAFYGCKSLSSIKIPNGIGALKLQQLGVFADCSALMRIDNFPTNCDPRNLGVSEKCVINYRQDVQVDYSIPIAAAASKVGTHASIPPGTLKIEDGAFSGQTLLTSIDIPDSVTIIGRCAFEYCSSLTSIKLPDGVTEIGSSAFEECSSLTSIKIPDSVTKIGQSSFSLCSSLTSIKIPDGVTEIGSSAFRNCSSLTSINIPDGVTEIGSGAFSGCSSLTSIKIPDGVTEIGSSAFRNCSSLTSIKLPDSVTEIGSSTFSVCRALTTINIPDGATKIDGQTFWGCTSLTSIKLPDSVTEIGSGAFQGCSSLTSINIPDGVTSIGQEVFRGCSSLTAIVIPKGVRFVGDEAFGGCTGLREITISRRFEDDLERIFKDMDLSEVKINWL